jgi:hypothetical protein
MQPRSLKLVPFVNRNVTAYHSFNLSNHNPELSDRVFGVGRDCQAMLRINHKLMAGAGIRPIELKLP